MIGHSGISGLWIFWDAVKGCRCGICSVVNGITALTTVVLQDFVEIVLILCRTIGSFSVHDVRFLHLSVLFLCVYSSNITDIPDF